MGDEHKSIPEGRDECAFHAINTNAINDHELRLRIVEGEIGLLKQANDIQNQLLRDIKQDQKDASNEQKEYFRGMDKKLLVILLGVLIWLVNQIVPRMFPMGG